MISTPGKSSHRLVTGSDALLTDETQVGHSTFEPLVEFLTWQLNSPVELVGHHEKPWQITPCESCKSAQSAQQASQSRMYWAWKVFSVMLTGKLPDTVHTLEVGAGIRLGVAVTSDRESPKLMLSGKSNFENDQRCGFRIWISSVVILSHLHRINLTCDRGCVVDF